MMNYEDMKFDFYDVKGNIRYKQVAVPKKMYPPISIEIAKGQALTSLGRDADFTDLHLDGMHLGCLDSHPKDISLSGINFSGCVFSDCDFRNTVITRCNFNNCVFEETCKFGNTHFTGCTFKNVSFSQVIDFEGLDGYYPDFHKCQNLDGLKLPPRLQRCPQDQDIIVWKSVRLIRKFAHTNDRLAVIKLLIPKEAKRTSSILGHKCRAEFAKVFEGPSLLPGQEMVSRHDKETRYVVGEMIYPDSYDPNPLIECTNGIHFFLTKKEAEAY